MDRPAGRRPTVKDVAKLEGDSAYVSSRLSVLGDILECFFDLDTVRGLRRRDPEVKLGRDLVKVDRLLVDDTP